jgi:hypothetical protein
MASRILLLCSMLLAAATLGGCDFMDPYQRPGNWRPSGVNEANLRAMLVNPADLSAPAPSSGQDGALSTAAVQRLHDGKAKPLPPSDIAPVSVQSSGGT